MPETILESSNQSTSAAAEYDSLKDEVRLVKKVENLVFQGGGVKGIAYLGALQELTDLKNKSSIDLDQIKRVCGASAGAMTALMISLGFNIADLGNELMALNFMELLDNEIIKEHTKDDTGVIAKLTNKECVAKLLEIYKGITAPNSTLTATEFAQHIVYGYFKYKVIQHFGCSESEVKTISDDLIKLIITECINMVPDSVWEYLTKINIPGQSILKKLFGIAKKTLFNTVDEIKRQVLELGFKAIKVLMGLDLTPIEKKLNTFFLAKDKITLSDFSLAFNIMVDNIWKDRGVFSGNELQGWIEKKLVKKFGAGTVALPDGGKVVDVKKITFAEYAKLAATYNLKALYVIVLNLDTGITEIHSAATTPDYVIAHSIRASISIPCFFKPPTIEIKNPNGTFSKLKTLYTDGGVNDNYAVWVFDKREYLPDSVKPFVLSDTVYNPYTLGFRLVTKKQKELYEEKNAIAPNNVQNNDGFLYYAKNLFYAFLCKQDSDHYNRGDVDRTIHIDISNFSTVDFDIGPAEKNQMVSSGQAGVLDFLALAYKKQKFQAQTDNMPKPAVVNTAQTAPVQKDSLYEQAADVGLYTSMGAFIAHFFARAKRSANEDENIGTLVKSMAIAGVSSGVGECCSQFAYNRGFSFFSKDKKINVPITTGVTSGVLGILGWSLFANSSESRGAMSFGLFSALVGGIVSYQKNKDDGQLMSLSSNLSNLYRYYRP